MGLTDKVTAGLHLLCWDANVPCSSVFLLSMALPVSSSAHHFLRMLPYRAYLLNENTSTNILIENYEPNFFCKRINSIKPLATIPNPSRTTALSDTVTKAMNRPSNLSGCHSFIASRSRSIPGFPAECNGERRKCAIRSGVKVNG